MQSVIRLCECALFLFYFIFLYFSKTLLTQVQQSLKVKKKKKKSTYKDRQQAGLGLQPLNLLTPVLKSRCCQCNQSSF